MINSVGKQLGPSQLDPVSSKDYLILFNAADLLIELELQYSGRPCARGCTGVAATDTKKGENKWPEAVELQSVTGCRKHLHNY